MERSSLDEAPAPRSVVGEDRLSSEKGIFETAIARQVPFARYVRIPVTFNATAHGDTTVEHSLPVVDADAELEVFPYNWEFASVPAESPYVYKPIGTATRPWTATVITLRCNLASAKCKLLVTMAVRGRS